MTTTWTPKYHVSGSNRPTLSPTGQYNKVHLHLDRGHAILAARTGRKMTLHRYTGEALCSPQASGWYERTPDPAENAQERCPDCVAKAARYDIDWPMEAPNDHR